MSLASSLAGKPLIFVFLFSLVDTSQGTFADAQAVQLGVAPSHLTRFLLHRSQTWPIRDEGALTPVDS